MSEPNELPTLEVRDLRTSFHTRAGVLPVVNGVSSGLSAYGIKVFPAAILGGLDSIGGAVAAIAILAGNRGSNLNMRAAFLEVLNDALGSLGVIVAAIVIATTGFQRADALAHKADNLLLHDR